jgi:glycyl-tRNA synthetase
MENLYDSNGLVFWSEDEIRLRRMVEEHVVAALTNTLKTRNRAFEFVQIEAPQITPRVFINKNYSDEDMFVLDDRFVLRPETTMGSYQAILHFLGPAGRIYKTPLVVWQHGKSFRREQDQPTKFMRLKEFYQLEFQIAYSIGTTDDYSKLVIPAVQKALSELIGPCRTEASDRLPDYAEETTDIICEKTNMEVCSISKRKDLSGLKVLEVAIGTDRCVYNFQNK